MKRVKLLDSAWLLLEKPETPMHVGILMRFSPPADAPPDYITRVVATLRASSSAESPWDLIVPLQRLQGMIPLWLHECYLDMEHHVQLHTFRPEAANSAPDELNSRLAELHGQPLDLSRPLWECHVFEGLSGGGFALYMKVHHSLLDGIGGMRLMQKVLAHSSAQRDQPAPWSPHPDLPAASVAPRLWAPKTDVPGGVDSALPRKKSVMAHLGQAARELTRAAVSHADQLTTPYRVPGGPFNQRITARRSFALERCEHQRLKRLAKRAGVSSNDVVLAVCAGALQRLLEEMDLRDTALTAGVPVSTRPRHGEANGTALSFCLANLGTDIRDPRTRLRAIHASTQRAKEHLGCLPRAALLPYTGTLMLPFFVEQLSRYAGRWRPMFNVVISNVPGPKYPLYLEGARLESVDPLSVLFHGQGINITCIRYTDQFSFGFTGCPDVLPGLEHMPDFTREALEELETEFSFAHRAVGKLAIESNGVQQA